MAFGAEFRIEPQVGSTLTAKLSWSCYYRVFPSFEQQKNYAAGAGYVAPEAPEESETAPSLIADDDGEEDGSGAITSVGDGKSMRENFGETN